MPTTRDIRNYADGARAHGKQARKQAQSQFNEVTGAARDTVSELTARAADAVNDLLAQAEKAVNLDAIKAAIEPYVAQARGYSTTVSDRAEELYSQVKKDERVAKLVNTAESVTGVVVETVQDRVVKPAQALTGRGTKPTARKPAAKATPAKKTATTKVAPKPAKTTARKASATKTTAKKTAAKKTAANKTTARKAPAKKSTGA
jgi:DNA-binding protein HU-beta